MNDEIGGVCIVTQPERSQTGKNHVRDLADIIEQLTTVAILTANLPVDSSLGSEYDVTEFSSKGTGKSLPVEVYRFATNQLRLCREIAKRDEAVILFFGAVSYVLPVLCSRLLGKKTIVQPRGDVPLSLQLRWEDSFPSAVPTVIPRTLAGFVELLERTSYRSADIVITYTPAMARELGLERYGEKLHPNGARFVDANCFDVSVPFGNREQCVGFIGRLDVEKRVPELAETARLLPDYIRFVFVGDGEYRKHLEQELADEIESGQVEIIGWVDREAIPEQLNRLRLLVVPSHPTEGLPTIILESMACGTPVYVTPVSGVPDVVREGETGFIIDSHEPARMRSDIIDILAREEFEDVSGRCRRLIRDEFSLEAAVERYRSILTDDVPAD